MSTSVDRPGTLELPERALLFHIGLMKTGTTSLQNAASALRPELLAQGVRYPGRNVNHRSAVNDFMGHSWGWGTQPVAGAWAKLRREIDRDTDNRIWVCHEFGANADDATAARWHEELGERAHVVVTLRSYGSLLPSVWQQTTKEGDLWPFETWLAGMLADSPPEDLRPFTDRHDQGRVVTRWAEAFGPENVTVVVVDKSTPTVLFDAFESMLGLAPGLLGTARLDGKASNRGMSVEEAEFHRVLNLTLREQLTWLEYCKWFRDTASTSLLRRRAPGPHDTRLVLPTWAAERAHERSLGHVEQIRASGVRVVGDLGLLTARVPSQDDPAMTAAVVPIDAAAEALLGVMRQGRRDEARLEAARAELEQVRAELDALKKKKARTVEKASGRELAHELGARVSRRLHRD
ncbi:hypothetical protein [Isoptericola dokdonensis]|jgi:hypothetical protein|uniref:Sulfotransferase family protein n=1 Tax=Isoptericola dokdonensis DS-3 TaxID=1300344 RepID=A0A168G0T6_9MICO|nr:hypothetical protein [Isoptericola dokdonensis]ANC32860.1 hypothetical protein I598_3351 [Isoptericola dokdonensis DS-3]